jgi:hypothetical protein
MRCPKAFGERIAARDPDRQTAEIQIRVALMNRFPALGPWHRRDRARRLNPKGKGEGTPQASVLQQRPYTHNTHTTCLQRGSLQNALNPLY